MQRGLIRNALNPAGALRGRTLLDFLFSTARLSNGRGSKTLVSAKCASARCGKERTFSELALTQIWLSFTQIWVSAYLSPVIVKEIVPVSSANVSRIYTVREMRTSVARRMCFVEKCVENQSRVFYGVQLL